MPKYSHAAKSNNKSYSWEGSNWTSAVTLGEEINKLKSKDVNHDSLNQIVSEMASSKERLQASFLSLKLPFALCHTMDLA